MDDKAFILDFIKAQPLATLSTVNKEGKPEAAVVGFGQTKELEIIFGTDNASRKYKNIQSNSAVALVIGWNDSRTVQYEGVAKELAADDTQLIRDNYWSKSPDAERYHDYPGERYFIVRPTRIRYTDLKKEPWQVIELTF